MFGGFKLMLYLCKRNEITSIGYIRQTLNVDLPLQQCISSKQSRVKK